MIPDRLVIRAYLLRALLLWLAVRAVVSAVLLRAGVAALHPTDATAVQVILVSVFACIVESYRRRERILLGNLGVHPYVLGALFALPALVGELVIGVIGALVT